MKYLNNNRINEVILSGFPDLQQYNSLFFPLLLIIYLFIITGNGLTILVIHREKCLHFPMYIFIGALSFMEICYTAITIPKMLVNLLDKKKKMPLNECFLQAYFLHGLGTSECYLLAAMAYDRYLAICKPLRYSSIMTINLYIKLISGCILFGLLSPVFEIILISNLPFCGPNQIQNLFCDFPPLIALACTDIAEYSLIESTMSSFIMLVFIFVIISYYRIVYVILKIKSKEGRHKAFSTCGTHLIVVLLFFGSIAFVYLHPVKRYYTDYDRGVGITYVVFTPCANPIIYGLRNQGIRKSLNKLFLSVKSLSF
ncbi:olfactory receptor 6N2-like [Rhinophrynus dorsalis]